MGALRLTVSHGCDSEASPQKWSATIKKMPATQEAGIFDESALLARAREGDLAAFNELVNAYSRKIFRLAKHITQNDEDAEDVLQETFLKAFEHLSGFQGQSKFYTWIVRIAVNESLMKLRKRKSDRSVPLFGVRVDWAGVNNPRCPLLGDAIPAAAR